MLGTCLTEARYMISIIFLDKRVLSGHKPKPGFQKNMVLLNTGLFKMFTLS